MILLLNNLKERQMWQIRFFDAKDMFLPLVEKVRQIRFVYFIYFSTFKNRDRNKDRNDCPKATKGTLKISLLQ